MGCSLRASAVVAIFFLRRLVMAWKVVANCGGGLVVCAAWHNTHRSHAGPCPGMWP